MRLEKSAMIAILHDEPVFSALFISYLLGRNIRIEEISSTSCSHPVNNAWRGCCSDWPISVHKEDRRQ